MSYETRTRKPVFPFRVDPHNPHRVIDSHETFDRKAGAMMPSPRLVDTFVQAGDAAWFVEKSNEKWRADEAEKEARLAAETKAREEAARIPGVVPVRPDAPNS